MSFFVTSTLTLALHTCLSEIDRVADMLPSAADACAFREACRAYDEKKANQLIDVALNTYLNATDTLFALGEYCKKFGLPVDFYGKRLPDILLFIASNEAEISRVLNEHGVGEIQQPPQQQSISPAD